MGHVLWDENASRTASDLQSNSAATWSLPFFLEGALATWCQTDGARGQIYQKLQAAVTKLVKNMRAIDVLDKRRVLLAQWSVELCEPKSLQVCLRKVMLQERPNEDKSTQKPCIGYVR